MVQRTCVFIISSFLVSCGFVKNVEVKLSDERSLSGIIEEAYHNGSRSVLIEGGLYYLDEPIILNSNDRKTSSGTFRITGKQNDIVIISGGKELQTQWQQVDDSIWTTSTKGERFDQLFINDEKQIRARYPNYTEGEVFNGTAVDAIHPETAIKWKNPKGGFIHALHRHHWGGYHYEITGKTKNDSLLYRGGWQNNRQLGMHPEYRYVENILEELDSAGEWFHDFSSNILYYFKPEEIDLSTAKVQVSLLESLIELRGSQTEPIQNIEIENMQFRHVQPTFMKTKEPLLRSDWMIYRGGAILIEGAEDCYIRNCSFSELGGNGVFVSNYNRNIEIESCEFIGLGANAICFVGSPNAVRNPNFQYYEFTSYDDLDFAKGPKSNNYPAQCKVTDCLIHDIGEIEKQVAGVQIAMASDITVEYNSIYNVPRAGINIGDGCWGGHLIQHNDVFNTVLETGDHGAFNSWGRDRFWYPDRQYMDSITLAHPELILLDAYKQTRIINNRFQCDHGWDIDLDDGSSNYLIESNICLSGGIKLREGFYRSVKNNLMINNSFHPHVWFEESRDSFTHNIVMTDYKPIRVPFWGDYVDHNFFSDSSWLIRSQTLGIDQKSIVGSIDFQNPGNGNYTLGEDNEFVQNGFQDIDHTFGVQSSKLKRKAMSPGFPELFMASVSNIHAAKNYQVLGATFKNIETLGEMSASGIGDKNGVLIVKVDTNSKAGLSGLENGDVIVSLGGISCKNIPTFMNAYQTHKWKQSVDIEVIRNQKVVKLILSLK